METTDTTTPLADEGVGVGGEKGRKRVRERKQEDSVGRDKVRMERRDERGKEGKSLRLLSLGP